jgi:hypothetical protein
MAEGTLIATAGVAGLGFRPIIFKKEFVINQITNCEWRKVDAAPVLCKFFAAFSDEKTSLVQSYRGEY